MERGRLRRRFTELQSEVHDSFWFVPALLMAAAVLLAQVTLWLDRTRAEDLGKDVSWLFGGTAEGAWTLLQVIAGSLITVISIAFSVTLIAIQQASAQFSPRLLRNFTSDRANQLVLGAYVATFIYALLILRDVREGNEVSNAFIPALSLFVAIVLAVVSLGLLVFFIHHITMSLQLAYTWRTKKLPICSPTPTPARIDEYGQRAPGKVAFNGRLRHGRHGYTGSKVEMSSRSRRTTTEGRRSKRSSTCSTGARPTPTHARA